ncbi:MAG: hypothetical protein Q8P99_02825 [bacterium]|nr:hypothetical protein [bacterium]MDZ4231506.1 hypothetical protein [Patescibacteria group bacterium]
MGRVLIIILGVVLIAVLTVLGFKRMGDKREVGEYNGEDEDY